ncbi:hypothetical protein VB834_09235 [Limnoraphis robusta Tam1]|uniref:Uncharacterized protein n=1 Tax=Limnoraphis robusta CCNP1315 TaxID=3110306 RepID=A0ABU5TXX5_9CYAN|nr:hypothetical protein [Limnoraphis robusta]MEA5500366.1 hypothetical protein [Limnoraphis robusta BA-68 BA1]MEA5519552.1 hypothetical protein [Limnoraphis robusta CCNP1315]MEA5539216.1 hypothetical protein [Limnoraphis robusta Tam1]MEA5545820.1 hypothetical protein [Limnoraphis robusta CCNP1324]
MATKKSAKEQVKKDIEFAESRKGSQRIITYAMVDKSSFVTFYVPEWFIVLQGEAAAKTVDTITATATPYVPKKPIKEPITTDENLQPTGGASNTGNKRIIRSVPKGQAPDSEGTSSLSIGRRIKLILKNNTILKLGTKDYRVKSFRPHSKMNAMAIKYFLQQAGLKDKVASFSTGKTIYLLDDVDVTLDQLGELKDNVGQATAV